MFTFPYTEVFALKVFIVQLEPLQEVVELWNHHPLCQDPPNDAHDATFRGDQVSLQLMSPVWWRMLFSWKIEEVNKLLFWYNSLQYLK